MVRKGFKPVICREEFARPGFEYSIGICPGGENNSTYHTPLMSMEELVLVATAILEAARTKIAESDKG